MSSSELAGKTAIITGASKGIGKKIAEHLKAEGCNVILIARNSDALKKAVDDLSVVKGGAADFVAANLNTAEGCALAAKDALAINQQVDIVINCAGDTKAGRFPEQSDEDWLAGFALKFFGAVRLTRALWPELKARGGTVINIGGAATYAPSAGFMVGGAVNAALAHFSKALSIQGLEDDVNVNIVHPGMTVTDRMTTLFETQAEMEGTSVEEVMTESVQKSGLRRLGQPEDIASLVTFLCLPNARHIQGQSINVDGGGAQGFH